MLDDFPPSSSNHTSPWNQWTGQA